MIQKFENMKSHTVIFVIVSLIALGSIAEAHRHKHGRHRSTSSTLTLRSCASKLDFLCLGRLWNQLENYKSNVSSIISDLETRVEERFDEYEDERREAELNRRLSILENTRYLGMIAANVVYDLDNAAREQCALNKNTDINNFRETLLAAVDACITNSNSTFSRTATQTGISNLNSTALEAEDKLCNCVEHIQICSTKSEKQTAKGCAEAAAVTLNYDLIQQQADTIYNDLNAQAVTALANVRTCLANIPIAANRDSLVVTINACRTL